jgi:hypothetical protein
MYSTGYSRQILIKLEFFDGFSNSNSNVRFYEKPSSGSQDVPCGRTDGHDEANSRFSQFCERTEKVVILIYSLGAHKFTISMVIKL